MTTNPLLVAPTPSKDQAVPKPSRWSRLKSSIQFLVALAGTAAFLIYLLVDPFEPPAQPVERVAPPEEIVSIVGPGRIRVVPGSPFDQKIEVVPVRQEVISDAVLTVTGRVVASLRPGHEQEEDYWQFDSVETLTAFTDWQKAQADIAFLETQLEQAKQWAAAPDSAAGIGPASGETCRGGD